MIQLASLGKLIMVIVRCDACTERIIQASQGIIAWRADLPKEAGQVILHRHCALGYTNRHGGFRLWSWRELADLERETGVDLFTPHRDLGRALQAMAAPFTLKGQADGDTQRPGPGDTHLPG